MIMVKKKVIESVTSTDPKTKRWKSLMSVARMAYESGDLRQAETLLARARELANELHEKSFAIHASEIGIAAVLLAKGERRSAGSRLQRTIAALESTSDPSQKELLAVALRFNAQVLCENGELRSAEKSLLKSMSILEDLGIDACIQLAYSVCDLCGLYVLQGRISEASQQINNAMEILLNVLGPEDPLYVRADMIYAVSMPMESETLLEVADEGIQRMEYAFGAKHPNVLRALQRYFKVLAERGDTTRLEAAQEKFGYKYKAK